jgi:hypothetical protein
MAPWYTYTHIESRSFISHPMINSLFSLHRSVGGLKRKKTSYHWMRDEILRFNMCICVPRCHVHQICSLRIKKSKLYSWCLFFLTGRDCNIIGNGEAERELYSWYLLFLSNDEIQLNIERCKFLLVVPNVDIRKKTPTISTNQSPHREMRRSKLGASSQAP